MAGRWDPMHRTPVRLQLQGRYRPRAHDAGAIVCSDDEQAARERRPLRLSAGKLDEDAEPPPAVAPREAPRRSTAPNPVASFERRDDGNPPPSAASNSERRVRTIAFLSESQCLRRSAPVSAVSKAQRPVSAPAPPPKPRNPAARSLRSLGRTTPPHLASVTLSDG
jgi:hypothetical protein